MALAALEREILTYLHKLAPAQQAQVLHFVKRLAAVPPTGVPGYILLPFAGSIDIASLESMKQAIEEDCEQINPNGW